jgi:hypothetical protein
MPTFAENFASEKIALVPKSFSPDIPLSFEGLATTLFLTNFRGSSDLNMQINQAFNGDIYYYVFGEKLAQVQLDGIGIAEKTKCPGVGIQSTPQDFINFYRKHRLDNAQTALGMKVGNMTWKGYFVSLTVNLVAGKENTYMFSLGFLARSSG